MCDLLSCNDCRHRCKNNATDKQIEEIWNDLVDIPFDEIESGKLVLSADFEGWEKGTWNEDIWHWFDKHHSKGIYHLLYEY